MNEWMQSGFQALYAKLFALQTKVNEELKTINFHCFCKEMRKLFYLLEVSFSERSNERGFAHSGVPDDDHRAKGLARQLLVAHDDRNSIFMDSFPREEIEKMTAEVRFFFTATINVSQSEVSAASYISD